MFDKKLTAQLAELGKIAFGGDELEQMTAQMTHIIQLMDKVKGFSVNDGNFRTGALPYASLRKDEVKPSLETERIIQNAKEVKDSSFVVSKVV